MIKNWCICVWNVFIFYIFLVICLRTITIAQYGFYELPKGTYDEAYSKIVKAFQ